MQSELDRLAWRQTRMLRPGVTLIETILVITILAAASVSGLILFDGQWVGRRNVKQVTTDVASTLTLARNTSINAQSMIRVTRQRTDGRQWLVIVEDAGPVRSGSRREIDLGTEIRISGRPRTIRFSPDGTANRNLTWNVAQQGVTGIIELAPVSGRITQTLP